MSRKPLLIALLMTSLLSGLGNAAAQTSSLMQKEIDALQGTWQLVSRTTEGDTKTEGVVKDTTIAFADRTFTMNEGEYEPMNAEYEISRGAKHKQLTLTVTERYDEPKILHAIYELDGDELRICFSFGDSRPTAFDASAGSRNEIFELRRRQSTNDGSWKEIRFDEHDLAISFPGKPEHQHLSLEEDGSVSVDLYQFVSEANKTVYQLALLKVEGSEKTKVPDQIRDFGIQIAKSVNADSLEEKSLELYGSPAHELIFSSSNGVKGQVTSIAVGDGRLVAMTVIGLEDDQLLDATTDQFNNSLILIAE